MATSGQVGQTVFRTRQVIDHAHRRAKIPAEAISGEMIQYGLENLWLILQELSSKGVPVWRIQRHVLGLYQGQAVLDLPVGTVEALNANLRTLQRLGGIYSSSEGSPELAFDGDLETSCTQVLADGYIIVDFQTETTVTSFGLLPTVSGTWSFVYEISTDSVTWVPVATFTDQAVVAREWLWTDVDITRYPSYQFARLRATDGTILDVIEWYVANTPQSIPMAPLNKDDYFNLPNKAFQGRPVQFWQDVRVNNPVLNLWPVPDFAANFQQAEVQVHRMIEDVGTMAQELDIPKRWYDAIVWALAVKQADEMTDYKGDINRLELKAADALNTAWGGITPKGPQYIQPNISYYTRG